MLWTWTWTGISIEICDALEARSAVEMMTCEESVSGSLGEEFLVWKFGRAGCKVPLCLYKAAL